MPNRLSLLPGLLYGNDIEGNQIKQYLLKGHNGRRVPEGELFDELIDTVPDADGNSGEEQHQWSKDEWYCLECVKDLFRQRFMVWWRQTKLKSTFAARSAFRCASYLTALGLQMERLTRTTAGTFASTPVWRR